MKSNDELLQMYINHRKNLISPSTLAMEESNLNKFLTYLDGLNPNNAVSLSNVTFQMMKEYFDKERKLVTDRTLTRKVTIISNFFNYLHLQNELLVDVMFKFRKRYSKLEWNLPKIEIDYSELLAKKSLVLESTDLKNSAKLVYLFLLNGYEPSEMIHIKLSNFTISDLQITLTTFDDVSEIKRTVYFKERAERRVIEDAIKLAEYREIDYIFSKRQNRNFIEMDQNLLSNITSQIEPIINMSITKTKQVRYAYIHYLSKNEGLAIEKIAQILGKTPQVTSKLYQKALERKQA